jgi:1,4-alpha-glucan branching enzyme
VTRADRRWADARWLARRAARDWLHAPMSIYELHLGSWRRGIPAGASTPTANWPTS